MDGGKVVLTQENYFLSLTKNLATVRIHMALEFRQCLFNPDFGLRPIEHGRAEKYTWIFMSLWPQAAWLQSISKPKNKNVINSSLLALLWSGCFLCKMFLYKLLDRSWLGKFTMGRSAKTKACEDVLYETVAARSFPLGRKREKWAAGPMVLLISLWHGMYSSTLPNPER